jgi:hypothetical protein
VVEQRLLQVCGPVKTELVQIVRGFVAEKKDRPALPDACVGVVLRMTATVDGEPVSVEEVGDCEDPQFWRTDGARLKDAFSDAYKRCAMRLGVGLHIWAQDEFYLADKLAEIAAGGVPSPGKGAASPAPPAPPAVAGAS